MKIRSVEKSCSLWKQKNRGTDKQPERYDKGNSRCSQFCEWTYNGKRLQKLSKEIYINLQEFMIEVRQWSLTYGNLGNRIRGP
jgi:hypothetical protein